MVNMSASEFASFLCGEIDGPAPDTIEGKTLEEIANGFALFSDVAGNSIARVWARKQIEDREKQSGGHSTC